MPKTQRSIKTRDRARYTLADHKIESLKNYFREYKPSVTKNIYNEDGYDPFIRVDDFVKCCIKKKDFPGYYVRQRPLGHTVCIPSPLARLFYDKINEWMRLYRPELHYSPWIDLFFRSCIDLRIAHEPLEGPCRTHSDGKLHAVRFNELVDLIRSEGLSKPFRNVIDEARSRRMKHFIRTVTDIDYLFEHVRSRMMVIRLDFHYRYEFVNMVEREEADNNFKRLLSNMKGKPTLFGDMLYYVWKAEQSRSGAYHYHFLFFFTNDRLRKDDYRAKQIGEYWNNEITQGRGTYFNANLSTEKAKHKKLAIGRIEFSDHEKRENMMNIVAYFCKDDQGLRVKVSKRTRSCGSSMILKSKGKKMGRPRIAPPS